MSDQAVKVLILMLYSGEHEFEAAKASLKTQTHTNWELRSFEFLPNLEANQRLYKTIMDESINYGLFLKMDADMVFFDRGALADIVSKFASDPLLDHAVFALKDWASSTLIMGMHAYSARVSWLNSDERLFVDPEPIVPGRREYFYSTAIADHMPDPTREQAYLFGYHRALKLVQRGRWIKHAEQARSQWQLLSRVCETYVFVGDDRRLAILAGAEKAVVSKESFMAGKDLDSVDYSTFLKFDATKLIDRWGPAGIVRTTRYWRWVILPRLIYVVGRFFLRRLKTYE